MPMPGRGRRVRYGVSASAGRSLNDRCVDAYGTRYRTVFRQVGNKLVKAGLERTTNKGPSPWRREKLRRFMARMKEEGLPV
jgi:hypothetical protein